MTFVGSRWPGGNILASADASGPGLTPGRGTFELDTGYRPFGSVKCVATSTQLVTDMEDCGCKLLPGVALPLRV